MQEMGTPVTPGSGSTQDSSFSAPVPTPLSTAVSHSQAPPPLPSAPNFPQLSQLPPGRPPTLLTSWRQRSAQEPQAPQSCSCLKSFPVLGVRVRNPHCLLPCLISAHLTAYSLGPKCRVPVTSQNSHRHHAFLGASLSPGRC